MFSLAHALFSPASAEDRSSCSVGSSILWRGPFADYSGVRFDRDINSVVLLAVIQSKILRGRREQAGRRFQEAFSLATRVENRAGDPLRGLCHLRRSGVSRPKGVVTRHTSRKSDSGKPPHTARLGLSPGVRNACVSMELGAVLSGCKSHSALSARLGWFSFCNGPG